MRAKRMKILISIVSGLLAAVLMAWYANSIFSTAEQSHAQALDSYGGEQVEVYVATRTIAAGERLTTANVSKRIWLVDLLPTGALGNEEEVIGQTVAIPLFANEPVTSVKLGNAAKHINIPDGYCAVSIATNDVLAVGGAINAGSVIAIYAADKESVELLAAEVLVLETSNSNSMNVESNGMFGGSRSKTALTWVTLAVEEDMVEEIIAASRSMNLYLVLPSGGQ